MREKFTEPPTNQLRSLLVLLSISNKRTETPSNVFYEWPHTKALPITQEHVLVICSRLHAKNHIRTRHGLIEVTPTGEQHLERHASDIRNFLNPSRRFDDIIKKAISTQPNSVFDTSRLFATS